MVCVLGASGFIGSHLLTSISGSKAASLRERDWRSVISQSDVIINLVGKAHDHEGTATKQDYNYVNVELTKQIYNTFIESSAKLMIHISSIAAIEEIEAKQALEEHDDCKPESWYGKSKLAADEWLLDQHIPDGKKLIILRPPMVHGPGDKGNLGLLYKLISKGIPYPLASFNNKRSFISIDNFIFFVEEIIKHQDKIESGIYHISDDEPIATKDIIEIIKDITGKKVVNIAMPKFFVKGIAKVGDVIPIPLNSKRLKKMTSDLLVSNNKIKFALGITQLPVTAREGLVKTISSFVSD